MPFLFRFRVFVLDWNIHHGQRPRHIFEDDKKILSISFYHCEGSELSTESNNENSTTRNISWNKHKMDGSDYIATFERVIMPIAYEFNPELVLVSVGFDEVIDQSANHYHVTPEAYGYFTHWLSSLANGKIILCFEGGYNVNSISHAMTLCTKALLGDPLPMLATDGKELSANCIETIQHVWSVQQKHWKCLKFNKKLPSFNVFSNVSKL